jgi:teichuronic acid biosynthesis glycosyltransferase TuaC
MRVLVVTSEWPTAAAPGAGSFVAEQIGDLEALGVSIDVLSFRGRSNPVLYAHTVLRLQSGIRADKFDLIHAHFGQAGMIAVLQRCLPTVLTVHGSDLHGYGGPTVRDRMLSEVLRGVTRWASRQATEVIAVSGNLRRLVPRRNVHVIPMGVDLNYFSPGSRSEARQLVGWAQDEDIVLFVGDPQNPIKRVGLAHAAVEHLRAARPRARLVVCTNQPREVVRQHYRAADALVITSRHEGGPLVAWEALACNLPIVSLDVGGVRERVSGRPPCEICPTDDPLDIASALLRCVTAAGPFSGRPAVAGIGRPAVASRVLEVYQQAIRRDTRS